MTAIISIQGVWFFISLKHSVSLSVSVPLKLCLYLSHTPSHGLSLSLTGSVSIFLSLCRSVFLSVPRSLTLSPWLSNSLTVSLTFRSVSGSLALLCLSLSLSIILTLSLGLSLCLSVGLLCLPIALSVSRSLTLSFYLFLCFWILLHTFLSSTQLLGHEGAARFEGREGRTLSPIGGHIGSRTPGRQRFITGLYQDEDRRLVEIGRQGGLTFSHSAVGDVEIQERSEGSSVPLRNPPMSDTTVDWSLLGRVKEPPPSAQGLKAGQIRF